MGKEGWPGWEMASGITDMCPQFAAVGHINLNPIDRNGQGGCRSHPGGRFCADSWVPHPAPGHQSPVQLLQPQVPPACQPALLDLPRVPDDTTAERECHLDCAPGAHPYL